MLALGDVVQEGDEADGAFHFDGRDGQLDRKLVTVAVEGLELQPLVQHPSLSRSEKPLQALTVSVPLSGRDDRFSQDPADRLLPGPAEGRLRLTVPLRDQATAVHPDDGFVGGLDDAAELVFALLEGGLGLVELRDVHGEASESQDDQEEHHGADRSNDRDIAVVAHRVLPDEQPQGHQRRYRQKTCSAEAPRLGLLRQPLGQ